MTGTSVFDVRKQPLPSSAKLASKPVRSKDGQLAKKVVAADPTPAPKMWPVVKKLADPTVLPEREKKAWQLANALVDQCSEAVELRYKTDYDYVMRVMVTTKETYEYRGLQNYGIVFKKGDEFTTWCRKQAPCYASINGLTRAACGDALLFVDWANKNAIGTNYILGCNSKEEHLATRWAYWLANDSVWARAYVEKNPVSILTKPTIYHTCYPVQFVLQAAMFQRYLTEQWPLVERWDQFVKAGCDKDAAVFLAEALNIRKDGTFETSGHLGHASFNSSMDEPEVLSCLYTKDYKHLSDFKSMEVAPGHYHGMAQVWCGKREIYGKSVNLKMPKPTAEKKPYEWSDMRICEWKPKNVGDFLKEVVELNLKETKRA